MTINKKRRLIDLRFLYVHFINFGYFSLECKQSVNISKNVSQNWNFVVIEGRRRIDALSDLCYNKGEKEMIDRIEAIKVAFSQIIQRRLPLLFRSLRPL